MRKFNYMIKDPIGIHARPAGLIVKIAQKYSSDIMIVSKEKSSKANKLMALLSMGIKCGDEVYVSVDGSDEESAYEELRTFFSETL